ncbi:reverse transcriptase domain-containing protein [Tanacetum coccineum]
MVPATTSLVGFSGEIKWPLGQITLLVKVGDDEHSTSAWMDFMVVNTKGIRICPDKVDAVLSLQSPKCLKDVQKLNGKLASLNRIRRLRKRRRVVPGTVDLVHGQIILHRRMQSRSDTHGSIGTGLRIAEKMGVKNLEVNVYSKLVANQVNGTYIAKETDMIKYLEKVKALTSTFRAFSIKQVPRSKNKKADALSKMASTSFAHLSKQVLVEELKEKSVNEREVLAVVEEEMDT